MNYVIILAPEGFIIMERQLATVPVVGDEIPSPNHQTVRITKRSYDAIDREWTLTSEWA